MGSGFIQLITQGQEHQIFNKEPQITWHYTRNNTLKKECYDMADSYTCVLGYMKQENIW